MTVQVNAMRVLSCEPLSRARNTRRSARCENASSEGAASDGPLMKPLAAGTRPPRSTTAGDELDTTLLLPVAIADMGRALYEPLLPPLE